MKTDIIEKIKDQNEDDRKKIPNLFWSYRSLKLTQARISIEYPQ